MEYLVPLLALLLAWLLLRPPKPVPRELVTLRALAQSRGPEYVALAREPVQIKSLPPAHADADPEKPEDQE